jgi:hypothetical protein
MVHCRGRLQQPIIEISRSEPTIGLTTSRVRKDFNGMPHSEHLLARAFFSIRGHAYVESAAERVCFSEAQQGLLGASLVVQGETIRNPYFPSETQETW